MKKIVMLGGFSLLSMGVYAQEIQHKRCATVEYANYRESKEPGYIQKTEKAFNAARDKSQNAQLKSQSTYTIPVVVHVVYNTATENIADSVIHNQIQVLNEDYNRENADSVNLRSEFFSACRSWKNSISVGSSRPQWKSNYRYYANSKHCDVIYGFDGIYGRGYEFNRACEINC